MTNQAIGTYPFALGEAMSDYVKKMIEAEEVELFINAYERTTGQRLTVIDSGERPDFICKRPNGRKVGVELTRAIADKLQYRWDQTSPLQKQDASSRDPGIAFEIPWALCKAASEKQGKVARGGWRLAANQLILVLQTVEVPLRQIKRFIDNTALEDMSAFGFAEIWVGDYSEVDAYANIELYCFKPRRWQGYYRRPAAKPYG